MGALASTTPTRTGTASPGNAVAASDTISLAQLAGRGALLEILNGNASADTVGVSDASLTSTGGAAAAISTAVAAGTNRVFTIVPGQADPVTGQVTITHTVTATVTYKLYPLG